MSEVENFYADRTIFITGVTGFLGHVLLSKLLCSCPNLRRIYVLIRRKKEKSINERLEEIFDSSIFQRVKKINPDYATKIIVIEGDCYQCNLGISKVDRVIIENEVEIVFHVAATVKFDASLREAAYINIRSTDILLDIAKNMKNLKAFMYVSTAFSPCAERKLIEEKFYDPHVKASKLLALIEELDDSVLDNITPALIKPHPNTYIYTKIIAESVCRDKGEGLPICIFRPAMVAPCYKEPAPGWINNLYGPVGLSVAYSLGILKVARVDEGCKVDIVPGDYTINALIVSAFHLNRCWQVNKSLSENNDMNNATIERWKFNPLVINNYSNTTSTFTLTWRILHHEGDKMLAKYPFYKCVTFPSMIMNSNLIVFRCLAAVFHSFPAFIVDTISILSGKKPKFGRLYQKIHKLFDLLTYFCTNEWVIPNHNIDRIWSQMSQKDKDTFYFNLNELNVTEYLDRYVHGMRLYVANDEDHTIQKATRKRKILLVLHYIAIIFVTLIFLWMLTFIFF